jgi:hypothetical protein
MIRYAIIVFHFIWQIFQKGAALKLGSCNLFGMRQSREKVGAKNALQKQGDWINKEVLRPAMG